MSRTLPFTKMHGAGNDYVLFDGLKVELPDDMSQLARDIAHRNFAVGFDQMLVVRESTEADFRMDIYNADGSQVEMCGNGIRAFYKYLRDEGHTHAEKVGVETLSGVVYPEWAGEGRISLTNDSKSLGWRWSAQGFAAMHKGFISLTPSARFAPISHAGQIYEFQANDAFRTGLEARASHHSERQVISIQGSMLGQWDLQTGLGLPFTTPAQALVTWEGQTRQGLSLNLSCRALAPAMLTARNEDTTPGTVLAEITLSQTIANGQWSLEVQNAFNRAWLDHISAYRALGLVAQGRWAQLRFTKTLKHDSHKNKNS